MTVTGLTRMVDSRQICGPDRRVSGCLHPVALPVVDLLLVCYIRC